MLATTRVNPLAVTMMMMMMMMVICTVAEEEGDEQQHLSHFVNSFDTFETPLGVLGTETILTAIYNYSFSYQDAEIFCERRRFAGELGALPTVTAYSAPPGMAQKMSASSLDENNKPTMQRLLQEIQQGRFYVYQRGDSIQHYSFNSTESWRFHAERKGGGETRKKFFRHQQHAQKDFEKGNFSSLLFASFLEKKRKLALEMLTTTTAAGSTPSSTVTSLDKNETQSPPPTLSSPEKILFDQMLSLIQPILNLFFANTTYFWLGASSSSPQQWQWEWKASVSETLFSFYDPFHEESVQQHYSSSSSSLHYCHFNASMLYWFDARSMLWYFSDTKSKATDFPSLALFCCDMTTPHGGGGWLMAESSSVIGEGSDNENKIQPVGIVHTELQSKIGNLHTYNFSRDASTSVEEEFHILSYFLNLSSEFSLDQLLSESFLSSSELAHDMPQVTTVCVFNLSEAKNSTFTPVFTTPSETKSVTATLTETFQTLRLLGPKIYEGDRVRYADLQKIQLRLKLVGEGGFHFPVSKELMHLCFSFRSNRKSSLFMDNEDQIIDPEFSFFADPSSNNNSLIFITLQHAVGYRYTGRKNEVITISVPYSQCLLLGGDTNSVEFELIPTTYRTSISKFWNDDVFPAVLVSSAILTGMVSLLMEGGFFLLTSSSSTSSSIVLSSSSSSSCFAFLAHRTFFFHQLIRQCQFSGASILHPPDDDNDDLEIRESEKLPVILHPLQFGIRNNKEDISPWQYHLGAAVGLSSLLAGVMLLHFMLVMLWSFASTRRGTHASLGSRPRIQTSQQRIRKTVGEEGQQEDREMEKTTTNHHPQIFCEKTDNEKKPVESADKPEATHEERRPEQAMIAVDENGKEASKQEGATSLETPFLASSNHGDICNPQDCTKNISSVFEEKQNRQDDEEKEKENNKLIFDKIEAAEKKCNPLAAAVLVISPLLRSMQILRFPALSLLLVMLLWYPLCLQFFVFYLNLEFVRRHQPIADRQRQEDRTRSSSSTENVEGGLVCFIFLSLLVLIVFSWLLLVLTLWFEVIWMANNEKGNKTSLTEQEQEGNASAADGGGGGVSLSSVVSVGSQMEGGAGNNAKNKDLHPENYNKTQSWNWYQKEEDDDDEEEDEEKKIFGCCCSGRTGKGRGGVWCEEQLSQKVAAGTRNINDETEFQKVEGVNSTSKSIPSSSSYTSRGFIYRYGILFLSFRFPFWWWILVEFMYSFLLAMIPPLHGNHYLETCQGTSLTAVGLCSSYLFCLILFRPFRNFLDNMVCIFMALGHLVISVLAVYYQHSNAMVFTDSGQVINFVLVGVWILKLLLDVLVAKMHLVLAEREALVARRKAVAEAARLLEKNRKKAERVEKIMKKKHSRGGGQEGGNDAALLLQVPSLYQQQEHDYHAYNQTPLFLPPSYRKKAQERLSPPPGMLTKQEIRFRDDHSDEEDEDGECNTATSETDEAACREITIFRKKKKMMKGIPRQQRLSPSSKTPKRKQFEFLEIEEEEEVDEKKSHKNNKRPQEDFYSNNLLLGGEIGGAETLNKGRQKIPSHHEEEEPMANIMINSEQQSAAAFYPQHQRRLLLPITAEPIDTNPLWIHDLTVIANKEYQHLSKPTRPEELQSNGARNPPTTCTTNCHNQIRSWRGPASSLLPISNPLSTMAPPSSSQQRKQVLKAEPPKGREQGKIRGGGKDYWRHRLTRYLQSKAPDRLSRVALMLEKYIGHEEEMMKSLVEKMGPEEEQYIEGERGQEPRMMVRLDNQKEEGMSRRNGTSEEEIWASPHHRTRLDFEGCDYDGLFKVLLSRPPPSDLDELL